MTNTDAPAPEFRDPRTVVLVVEPSASALAVLARRIGEAGYRVIAAANPEAAVAELRRRRIDLILADLGGRSQQGVALTRLVRDDSRFHDLPVILISGRSDPGGTVTALQSGADDVIAKPFHFEVLLARIARQLARARALGALKDDKAALDARIIAKAIENGELRDRLGRAAD